MKILLLITLLALGNIFTLVSESNTKIEIGRVEATKIVNESESTDTPYDKDEYYAEPNTESNNKGA